MPSASSGMETIAPSGKFWMAIPIARTRAAAWLTPASPASQPAYTTPTAIPSGILWRVTARISLVVRFRPMLGPSTCWSICICGVISSSSSRKPIPIRKPTEAGRNESLPIDSLLSSAGSSRLQNEAATMTPAAKPVRIFCRFPEICFFRKNTIAAPRLVPRKGIRIPVSIVLVIFVVLSRSVGLKS